MVIHVSNETMSDEREQSEIELFRRFVANFVPSIPCSSRTITNSGIYPNYPSHPKRSNSPYPASLNSTSWIVIILLSTRQDQLAPIWYVEQNTILGKRNG